MGILPHPCFLAAGTAAFYSAGSWGRQPRPFLYAAGTAAVMCLGVLGGQEAPGLIMYLVGGDRGEGTTRFL